MNDATLPVAEQSAARRRRYVSRKVCLITLFLAVPVLLYLEMGQPTLAAGQTIKISGLGRANGTYYIDKLTHSVGDSYTTAFECSKVQ